MMKKRIFKRLLQISVVAIMIVPCFIHNTVAEAATNANTLGELKSELQAYKNKKQGALNNKNQTQSQINANKNNIIAKNNEITVNKQKIEDAKAKIIELDKEIEETEVEIEELLRSYEMMNGDNDYLEYVFGAKNISDFIIRYSISEQLASYNDSLIEEYENKIKENEQLQIDLAQREKDLNAQISNLEKSIDSLGNKLEEFDELALKFEDEIKSTQQLIDFYVSQGCKDNDLLTTCVKVMSDTGFVRPLKKGTRTSNFGYRTHPVTGVKNKFHSGVDIGGNPEGTPVYSIAAGMVGKIIRRSSCGGNAVYIYHTVNGVQYTSTYMHLLTMNVKVGDMVTNQTVIGTVGGGAGTRYDTCSTGPHLHLSLATGWYGKTYQSYSTWVSRLIDAGSSKYCNIPGLYKYFYSRTW